jgi:PadR family transcriptional regulator, regulatory protein AphA
MSSVLSDERRPRLTETSFIVLGLIDQAGCATPYDLKRAAQLTTANFWSVPHTQLYGECARLAAAGLLDERREQTGRRRRTYRLTERGRELLREWSNQPTGELYELRDASTLKLFFGGDPAVLAASQLEAHSRQLEVYERVHASLDGAPSGQRLALECGIGHEREFIRFWSQVLGDGDGDGDGNGNGTQAHRTTGAQRNMSSSSERSSSTAPGPSSSVT